MFPKEYPILEFDEDEQAIIHPPVWIKIDKVPELGVITFFGDIVASLVANVSGEKWDSRDWNKSTMREKLIYLAREAVIELSK